MKDHQVNSIKDYLKYLDRFEQYSKRKKLFFRGQLTKYLNMNPTIDRGNNTLLEENNIFNRYKVDRKSDFQNLAYQQHHGNPTRILDMTIDPLVALFFAVNNSEREDSSIYVFIRDGVSANSDQAKLMSFLATTPKRKIPDIVKDFNEKYDGELIEKLTEERATEILSQDLFITPNTLEDEDNKRMQEQKDTFVFPANIIENETIVGIKDFQDDKSYQEIIIPFEFHDEIFSQLKDMNYSSKRLYGDTSKDLAVPVLKDLKSMVNGKFKKVTAPFSKGNEEIFTNVLLKKSEIEDLGYQIATERNVDMLTLWFKRNNTHSHDGVNILRQVWYQGSRRKCVDDGIKIGKFIKTEDWSDDFYIDRLLFTNSDVTSKRKILPPLENALKVKMKVDYTQNGKIRFHTNLFSGAKLFVTYNGLEDTITTKEGKQDYYIDVDKRVKRIIGDITLITPSLQTKEFLDRAGNDFENLIGDFIKRDDDSSSLISGHQKFNLSTISE